MDGSVVFLLLLPDGVEPPGSPTEEYAGAHKLAQLAAHMPYATLGCHSCFLLYLTAGLGLLFGMTAGNGKLSYVAARGDSPVYIRAGR